MKKLLTILMAAASLTIAAHSGDNNQAGRYQIIAADVDHSGAQTVFKIDTVTGQAWTYREGEIIQDKTPASISQRFWSSVNEQPPTVAYRLIVGR
jgi:hypothetical protein